MASTISNLLTPGRLLILLGNLSYSIGAFAADFNTTHVFNPRWPPHAKFHNGQTMSLGILLALTSISFLIKSTHPSTSKAALKDSLFWAATIGSLYCLAGLSAIWYPGTAWADPEFRSEGQLTQMPIFGGVVVGMWTGFGTEVWRMGV